MKTAIYIQGSGIVSPQNNVVEQGFPKQVVEYISNYLRCIEPDINGYIQPIAARRMSSIIKRAIVAAKLCVAQSGIEKPDAIISGTGLGCIEDTEKFLKAMIENEERFLQPTSFIQSTHNTVSSQIAIALNCHGYNSTYVNRGFSFESALLDGMMLLMEQKIKNVMIGSFDEMTPSYYQLLSRINYWKKEQVGNSDLLKHCSSEGTIAGEGCAYFMLSNEKSELSYARVQDLKMIYKPANTDFLIAETESFLENNGMKKSDIDILVSGVNGDSRLDDMYQKVHQLFNCNISWYKHLSGDYYTASSYGFWVAAQILKKQEVPGFLFLKKANDINSISNVLLFNNYRGSNITLILLKAC